jgi:flagellar biosynthesis protein FlhB
MSDKTEEPTPRKLRKAREQGDSPVSGALGQGFAFVAAFALCPAAIEAVAARASTLIRTAVDQGPTPVSARAIALDVVTLSVPIIGVAAVLAAATGLVQSGFVVATQKVTPDFSRLDPVSGLKNLFSKQRLLGLARSLIAALLVGYLAVRLLMDHAADVARTTGEPALGIFAAGYLLNKLGWIAALVGLALGALDLIVVRRAWLERNRMTKDEVKREHKESEGDPEIKAARQRAHQEMLAGATIAAVKDASVVVVNPTHLATALRYQEDEDDAPEVVAQGRGELAQQMIRAANAYGVPVIRDVPVARALSELEVGDEIPEALYEAVAEILRQAWAELEAEGER